jgi:N-alpha-acetyl-L-2,4-diaminobutyrate deacetylase
MADIVLDFHSGGRTLDFLPYAAAHTLPDKAQERRCFDVVAAFSAPYSMSMMEIDSVGMFDTVVEEAGKIFVTTELRGGGAVTAESSRIAKRGVRNVLKHMGILAGAVDARKSRWLDMPSDACFGFAEEDGLVEPLKDLGDAVQAGEVVARIHALNRTGGAPVEHRARLDGVVAGRHFPGLVKIGDCLAVIAALKP